MIEENEQPAEQRPEPAMEETHHLSAVVLVAEDNEYTLDTVSDYLEAKGYEVVVARNGEEAIARAREDRPDVILMDVQMPVMDGEEAIRHIRADADLADVPIIALTAMALPDDRDRCLEAGATTHLSKPIGMKRVVQVIEEQLGRRPA